MGRDVAEAFDTVSQEVVALKASVAKLSAVPVATPAVQTVKGYVATAPASSSKSSSTTTVSLGPTQVTEVTGNYTMVIQDLEIQVTATGPATIQLLGSTEGAHVTVKNYSANGIVITIEDSAGGMIDGGSNTKMQYYGTAADFVFDGTSNWAVS